MLFKLIVVLSCSKMTPIFPWSVLAGRRSPLKGKTPTPFFVCRVLVPKFKKPVRWRYCTLIHQWWIIIHHMKHTAIALADFLKHTNQYKIVVANQCLMICVQQVSHFQIIEMSIIDGVQCKTLHGQCFYSLFALFAPNSVLWSKTTNSNNTILISL